MTSFYIHTQANYYLLQKSYTWYINRANKQEATKLTKRADTTSSCTRNQLWTAARHTRKNRQISLYTTDYF